MPATILSHPQRRSVEETQRLWQTFAKQPTPELRESLIVQYLPLVKYVAGRLPMGLPSSMDFDDILSNGNIGLIQAVERFDPSKNIKFETYAISRIRGAIIDSLRRADRLPRGARRNLREIDDARTQLRDQLGRIPTETEIASRVGVTLARYRNILTTGSWVTLSLDSLLDTSADGDGYPSAEAPRDPDAQDVHRSLQQEETVRELAGSIRKLPEREQLVISLYYEEELTQREIAKVLRISESRVCQLHSRAVGRLRTFMQERGWDGAA